MQRSAPESQLAFFNTTLSKVSGSDTSFTVELGANYSTKRMVLRSCTIDNLFSNFYGSWSNLSVVVNGVIVRIEVDYYLTRTDVVPFINDQLAAAGQALVLTDVSQAVDQLRSYDKRLRY